MTNRSFITGGGEGVTTNDESDDTAVVINPLGATLAIKGDFNADSHSEIDRGERGVADRDAAGARNGL